MALVSITEAAKLVRRNRSTLYRDIERGRLSKTITPEGETQIDTSELLRAYGRLQAPGEEEIDTETRARTRIALLEERNRSLERALALEAELRKVKDQVTSELRARLADKDNVIKVLENKVLFLEYDRQVETLPREQSQEDKEDRKESKSATPTHEAAPAPSPVSPPPASRNSVTGEVNSGASSGTSSGATSSVIGSTTGGTPSGTTTPRRAEDVMPRKGWWARLLRRRG